MALIPTKAGIVAAGSVVLILRRACISYGQIRGVDPDKGLHSYGRIRGVDPDKGLPKLWPGPWR